MSLSRQIRDLNQLSRNVKDAADRVAVLELEVFANELADWVAASTQLLSEVAMEVLRRDREEGAPVAPMGDEAATVRVRTPTDKELDAELRQHAEHGR